MSQSDTKSKLDLDSITATTPAPTRRIITSSAPAVQKSVLDMDSSAGAEMLLRDALHLIQMDIAKSRKKIDSGLPLTPGESRILQGHVRSLAEISRELRARAEEDDTDFSDMTDAEFEEAVQKFKEKRAKAKKG